MFPKTTRLAWLLPLALLHLGCGSDSGGDAQGGAGGGATGGGGAGGTGTGGSAGATGGAGGTAGLSCSAPPKQFWTWDLGVMPPKDVQIAATCRGQSAHANVYVADSVWGTDVTEPQVGSVLAAFDSATPADSTKGVYGLDVETFGEPPDVDQDPRVNLFYVPMKPFQGISFDGFFRDTDQGSGATSNQTEMLHLNSSGSNPIDSDYMLGVVAHELVHLIAWKYDPADEGWLSEALAEVAMVRAGYLTDLPAAKSYAKATSTTPLCVKSYSDYGATFSFGAYVWDRFGASFVKGVTQEPIHGRAGIEAHLPGGSSFRNLFGEFMVATRIDQPGIGDGRFGYSSIDISGIGSEISAKLDGSSGSFDVVHFGSRTLRFTPSGAGTVSVTLSSSKVGDLITHAVVANPSNLASAKVEAKDAAAGPISVNVGAGEVLDLVIAVDPGSSLASGENAPVASVSYQATFSP